ncbi:enoyl-CoA hydratase [Ancylobacter sp. VNQ12]|uniref:enoyl-CoA hydratase n=1 Tax=Ancylobacter sp. VNQ12 TaxID=3400920 RepID=UPI003BFDFA92
MSVESDAGSYETILVERRDRVALVTLNRPKALNALNSTVMQELTGALAVLDRDPGIGCIVITGSEKAFAAGADIKEMQPQSYMEMFYADFFAGWDALGRVRKPIIAAVAGFALGGGCELAMMCDIIIAADTAKFGQPEIKLGVIPGIGGSQRLTRVVGKAKAMEMCLTGRMMDAVEAERSGLVARIVPAADLLADALATAATIAGMSTPIAMMVKESINRSYETTLAEGIRFERRVFHATFATADQKEGMAAFLEKRPAQFSNG